MAFCAMHVDWYQNLIKVEKLSYFDFAISIFPTILIGLISVFVIFKIGVVGSDYEFADDSIKQFYSDALHGKKSEAVNQQIIEDRLKEVGYSKLDNCDFDTYHLDIKRALQKDISSFAVVVTDRNKNIDGLYSSITDYCSNLPEYDKNSKLCIYVLYFGNFDKKFIKTHTHENRDDDVIINCIIYNNDNQCVYSFNPDSVYSKAFRKMSVSFLSLYNL